MPFHATLEYASTFKAIVEAVKDLVNEANFELDCDVGELRLQAMDSSNVSMVVFKLAVDVVSGEGVAVMGIKISSLAQILKTVDDKDNDKLELYTLGHEDNKLALTFRNKDRDAQFELKLMTVNQEQYEINQDTKYETAITMDSKQFQKYCRDLAAFGDEVVICSNDDNDDVSFRLKRSDIADVTIELKKETTLRTIVRGIAHTYSLKYLSFFAKATPLSKFVDFHLADGVPMRVRYDFDGGSILYYLAPRVDED